MKYYLKMERFPQPVGEKGSLKWIQTLINHQPEPLNMSIRNNLGFPESEKIRWLSPLAEDDYAEYRDQAFIDRLGVSLDKKSLKEFWPVRGPQWDALGKTNSDNLFLLESKSHIRELISSGTRALSESLRLIQASLNETKQYMNSKSQADWSSFFYQYTNRLAHLYLLRVLNKLPAYLIFVYFTNDVIMKGPKTEDEWRGNIKLLHYYLGVRRHKLSRYITDVFIDVRELK